MITKKVFKLSGVNFIFSIICIILLPLLSSCVNPVTWNKLSNLKTLKLNSSNITISKGDMDELNEPWYIVFEPTVVLGNGQNEPIKEIVEREAKALFYKYNNIIIAKSDEITSENIHRTVILRVKIAEIATKRDAKHSSNMVRDTLSVKGVMNFLDFETHKILKSIRLNDSFGVQYAESSSYSTIVNDDLRRIYFEEAFRDAISSKRFFNEVGLVFPIESFVIGAMSSDSKTRLINISITLGSGIKKSSIIEFYHARKTARLLSPESKQFVGQGRAYLVISSGVWVIIDDEVLGKLKYNDIAVLRPLF